MEPKKHRKISEYTLMILPEQAEEGEAKKINLGSKKAHIIMALLGILFIADLCYCIYNPILMSAVRKVNRSQTAQIKELTAEKERLEAENRELTGKVAVLSETINQKVKLEEEQEAESAKQSMPDGFPLTGAAVVQEQQTQNTEEGEETEKTEPIMVFKGTTGNMVVSSGSGVVTAVETDMEYGNKVIIDHGNGYQSIYRNLGEARVKAGDEVVRGATLFVIEELNTELGYQIIKDETYIDPEELVEING